MSRHLSPALVTQYETQMIPKACCDKSFTNGASSYTNIVSSKSIQE